MKSGALPFSLVIPAAGVGTRVQDIAFSKPKPLISVAGKPVLSWILGEANRHGIDDIVITVPHPEGQDPIATYVSDIYGDLLRPKFVHQNRMLGPLHAVLLSLSEIDHDSVLVVLGDTIWLDDVRDFPKDESWVVAASVPDQARWCLVSSRDGYLERIYDKPTEKVDTNLALVGVYYFHDKGFFRNCAEEVIKAGQMIANEYQISSAMELYRQRYPVRVIDTGAWYDCGSIENLRVSQDALMERTTRAFNSIKVSAADGTVTKTSSGEFGSSTLKDEISFYREISSDIAPYFPRVLAADQSEEIVYLTLEYWPMTNLAELFVYQRYSGFLWTNVAANLARVLKAFRLDGQRDALNKATFEMLWTKTVRRMDELRDSDFAVMEANAVIINGTRLDGWSMLADKLEQIVEEISESPVPSVLHGDLCFSNILCDISTGVIKLVDPRGRFGEESTRTKGDQRYDLAKLRHSYHGQYDLIVHNLFRLHERDGNDFDFRVFDTDYHRSICQIFDEVLTGHDEFLRLQTAIIEGLLFISMCPLHYEDRQRQKALWLTGLRLLNDAVGSYGEVTR